MADNSQALEKFKGVSQELLKVLGDRAMSTVTDRVSGLSDKFEGIADGSGPVGKAVAKGGEAASEGKSPVGGAVKGALSGVKDKITGGGSSSGGSGEPTKATNIIEEIDVGVPLSVAYNAWTEFGEFPTFMKKVERAEAEEETKINFKAQIFWSHRSWEATILEQVPDERIVWRSSGEKGHVDGAVTFHELGPNLTRILVVLEYYPQGLFERTGNLWRAQGRRARLELKHFRRHVMTRTILEMDEVEGWRGVIEDSEVVKTHEEVVEEEQQDSEEEGAEEGSDDGRDEGAEDQAEYDEEPEEGSEEAEEEPEDEYEEPEPEEEPEDEYEEPEEEYEEPEGEAEEEPEEEYDEPEGEAEEEYEEPEEEAEYDEEPEEEAEEAYEEETEPEDEEPEEKPTRRRRRAS